MNNLNSNEIQEGVKETQVKIIKAIVDRLRVKILPLHTPDESGFCSCDQIDCPSIGKHPRTTHGIRDASASIHNINAWVNLWPGTNIGIATGEMSNLVVIDVDARRGGHASLANFENKYGRLPQTLTVETGNGHHFYYQYPHHRKIKVGCKNNVLPGIDIRGNGGYVVAPPSWHASGVQYQWIDKNEKIATLPPSFLDLIIGHSNSSHGDYQTAKIKKQLVPRTKKMHTNIAKRIRRLQPDKHTLSLLTEIRRLVGHAKHTK